MFVSSQAPNAFVAHLGTPARTLCGATLVGTCRMTKAAPDGRGLCRICLRRGWRRGLMPYPAGHDPVVQQAATDARLLDLLCRGLTIDACARRLCVSRRTASRWIEGAMRRAGADTRMRWAYVVGLAEGERRARSTTTRAA